MKIAVSGTHGFVGKALKAQLEKQGHQVLSLLRGKEARAGAAISWDPEEGRVDTERLQHVDAVVHLAGESILGLWTKNKKEKISKSRVNGTRLLSEAMAAMSSGPRHFLCAGAIGIYGNRGEETLTEESGGGAGFLADVCKNWEGATVTAKEAGIRVVNMRFPVVLDPSGGALKTMLTPFKLAMGGRLGNGLQYFSWVTRDDLLRAISFLCDHHEISGPVNIVAPGVVTNGEFTKALAKALHRPAFMHVPAAVLKLVAGGMAEEMLLASQNVKSKRLEAAGFVFRAPTIETALSPRGH